MAKTILVPIDFRIESLNTLKLALEENKGEKVNVVLMYAEYLTNSITELLFYSPYKRVKSLSSEPFNDAINILKNSYESTIQSFRIELFHGINVAEFRNFVDAKKVDVTYIPSTYVLRPQKNGFDPLPIIKRSRFVIKELSWDADNKPSDNNQLNQLFK